MRVTAIEKYKGSNYHLFVDDEYAGTFQADVLAEADLHPGKECDPKKLQDLKRESELHRAKERALYLLEYRDHSRKELVDKLCKNVSPEVAEEVADLMEQLGFLDDWAYTQKAVKKMVLYKHRGARRVLWEMEQKGIDPQMTQEAIDLLQVDTVSLLVELIHRKYEDRLGDYRQEQRTVAALARMGHSYDDIHEAISFVKQEWDEAFDS